MNTLREIGAFIGATQTVSMRAVGNIVPLLSGSARTSMRAMIQGLQSLPPVSLEVEPVGNRYGDAPFVPVFRVHPSGGVILETRFTILPNGQQPEESTPVGNFGDFGPFRLVYPGIYAMSITRTGIPSTGITVLEKKFQVEAVQPVQKPPPPIPPSITVQSKGDGSFVVNGSGFLPKATVHILVGDGTFREPLAFADTSDSAGNFVGFPTGKICQGHGDLFFSANDGRLDPSNSSTLTSNTVRISCPF